MLTLADMSLDEMERIANDGHVCGECGGLLGVAWVKGRYVLRCGNNLEHNKITRHDYKNEERIRQYKMDSTALTKLDQKQMLERISTARFPQQLNRDEMNLLATMARNYGFDPAMGEMTIYQGRPYVSIDGRYRKAQETGIFNGVNARPATEQERKSWGIPEGDFFFQAEVRVKGCDYPFIGWGRVFAAEVTGGKGFKPIEKNPQRMAEKRAEAQALRKAFHIDLPSIEDAGTPEDPNIVESTATVVTENNADKPQDSQGDTIIGDTDIPANVGELCQWALTHGKTYTGTWLARQVGEKSAADIKDIKTAYFTIKEVTGWEAYRKGGTEPTK